MKFFSRILKFSFTEKELELVQLICAFVQKIKKCPDIFRRESLGFPKTSGHFYKRKM